jgi:hypothetical protein
MEKTFVMDRNGAIWNVAEFSAFFPVKDGYQGCQDISRGDNSEGYEPVFSEAEIHKALGFTAERIAEAGE